MTIEATLERIATALETLAAAPRAATPTPGTSENPKATRQRKTSAGGSTSEAESTSHVPATTANQVATAQGASGASTTVSQTSTLETTQKSDDMFGEDEKPAETKKAETKKEVKKTLDDVRAALVAAQTALKSKDKAVALLTEVAGAPVLSKLKEEDFGKLIDKCNAAVKAAA